MKKRDRFFHAPRLPLGGLPRKVPEGKFIWHNHVQYCVGMSHGLNGFRCWNGLLPIDYRQFERCHCGWIDLPHYKRRGVGSGNCVSPEQILRNCGFSHREDGGGSGMKALEVSPRNWAVVDRGIIICTGFTSNEAAWRWIDEHTRDGRIDSSRFNRNRIVFDGSSAA